MTLDEFFGALARVKDKYTWVNRGQIFIRAKFDMPKSLCPICLVCWEEKGEILNSYCYRRAAELLEIDEEIASAIVDAADGKPGPLRNRLLATLGL